MSTTIVVTIPWTIASLLELSLLLLVIVWVRTSVLIIVVGVRTLMLSLLIFIGEGVRDAFDPRKLFR